MSKSTPMPVQQATPISLDTRGAAAVLGVEPKTLANWRHLGKGPRYFHSSESDRSPVLYLYEDLQAWARERVHG